MQQIPTPERELFFFDYFLMAIFLIFLIIPCLYFLFYASEIIYQRTFKKPLIVFGQLYNKKLSPENLILLQQNSLFYSILKPKYQVYFEHRVATFIDKCRFSGRDIEVSNEMKIAIAAVYIQLTFGMKNFLNKLIKNIIIYPNSYISASTNQAHKGEFNPRLKTIVFSWEDFKKGLEIPNDNLNLGFHEFTHALHFSTLKSEKPAHVLFNETLQSLFKLFANTELRTEILQSGFLRDYAFENQYEFVAVLLEHFFETPEALKQKFPTVYQKVKIMINYNEKVFVKTISY